MFSVPSGDLKHIITIQGKSVVENADYGGSENVWVNLHSDIRAKKKPLSGKELITANAAQSEAIIRFVFRFISGVNTAMQIIEGGDTYKITSCVDINGDGQWLEVMTKKTGGA
jgi:SPP1 family predicted phage head-tail adaptor